MKKIHLVLLSLLLVLLTACSSNQTASSQQKNTNSKPVEIVMAGFSGPELDAHKRLAPKFEQFTNGRVKVRVEEIARDSYDTKMTTTLQSKTGAYDVFLVNVNRFNLWNTGKFLLPLNDFFDHPEKYGQPNYDLKDYPQAMLDLFKDGNNYYAVPQEASALMLFYRKDLFKKYGIQEPTEKGFTWEEYLNAAKKIQDGLRKDGIKDVFGTVHSGKRSQHIGYETAQAIWSFGGGYLDNDNHVLIDAPEAVKATKTYLSQDTDLKVTPPGEGGYEYPEVLTAFQQGKAAMAIEWNAAASTFYDPSKSPEISKNVGVTVFPYEQSKGPDTKRIWPSLHAVAVASDSKHPKEAIEYLAWFTSKETAKDYVVNGGGSSGRKTLLTSDEVLQKDPWYKILSKSFELYNQVPKIPELTYINEQIYVVHLNSIITSNNPNVEEELKAAKQEMEDYLKKKGRLK